MFRTAQNRSEQVISVGWQVIEESCRVENFHDASEHARCSSKPGARHHAVELASSRAAPPGETVPLSRNPDPRSYDDRSVVGTGSGRIAVYPKIIPGQKSTSRRSVIDLPEPRLWSHSVLPPRCRRIDCFRLADQPDAIARSALGSFSAAQPGSAGRRARVRRRCRVSG
jgi:hypothetical protein